MALNTCIEINGKKIGNGHSPYIIAEMACAHNGDFDQAKQLIDAAIAAKADAVQLQFFVPESTVTPHHEAFSVLKKIAFSKEEWKSLFDYGKKQGIDVWVCTYDMPSVEWAKEFGADGIKLNSADLSNPEVLSAVASSGIPFTMGTGASRIEEVRSGIEFAQKSGTQNIVLMHGVQNFPTQIESLNIGRLKLLKKEFPDVPCGYADHTDAKDPFSRVVDLIAIGLEANLIEKHITLDRTQEGIDFQAALEPSEFSEFVVRIRTGFIAFGSQIETDFTQSDLKYRKFQKKSVVAARELLVGMNIRREDVTFLRNDVPGLAPSAFKSLEGKTLNRNIKKFQNITTSDVN